MEHATLLPTQEKGSEEGKRELGQQSPADPRPRSQIPTQHKLRDFTVNEAKARTDALEEENSRLQAETSRGPVITQINHPLNQTCLDLLQAVNSPTIITFLGQIGAGKTEMIKNLVLWISGRELKLPVAPTMRGNSTTVCEFRICLQQNTQRRVVIHPRSATSVKELLRAFFFGGNLRLEECKACVGLLNQLSKALQLTYVTPYVEKVAAAVKKECVPHLRIDDGMSQTEDAYTLIRGEVDQLFHLVAPRQAAPMEIVLNGTPKDEQMLLRGINCCGQDGQPFPQYVEVFVAVLPGRPECILIDTLGLDAKVEFGYDLAQRVTADVLHDRSVIYVLCMKGGNDSEGRPVPPSVERLFNCHTITDRIGVVVNFHARMDELKNEDEEPDREVGSQMVKNVHHYLCTDKKLCLQDTPFLGWTRDYEEELQGFVSFARAKCRNSGLILLSTLTTQAQATLLSPRDVVSAHLRHANPASDIDCIITNCTWAIDEMEIHSNTLHALVNRRGMYGAYDIYDLIWKEVTSTVLYYLENREVDEFLGISIDMSRAFDITIAANALSVLRAVGNRSKLLSLLATDDTFWAHLQGMWGQPRDRNERYTDIVLEALKHWIGQARKHLIADIDTILREVEHSLPVRAETVISRAFQTLVSNLPVRTIRCIFDNRSKEDGSVVIFAGMICHTTGISVFEISGVLDEETWTLMLQAASARRSRVDTPIHLVLKCTFSLPMLNQLLEFLKYVRRVIDLTFLAPGYEVIADWRAWLENCNRLLLFDAYVCRVHFEGTSSQFNADQQIRAKLDDNRALNLVSIESGKLRLEAAKLRQLQFLQRPSTAIGKFAFVLYAADYQDRPLAVRPLAQCLSAHLTRQGFGTFSRQFANAQAYRELLKHMKTVLDREGPKIMLFYYLGHGALAQAVPIISSEDQQVECNIVDVLRMMRLYNGNMDSLNLIVHDSCAGNYEIRTPPPRFVEWKVEDLRAEESEGIFPNNSAVLFASALNQLGDPFFRMTRTVMDQLIAGTTLQAFTTRVLTSVPATSSVRPTLVLRTPINFTL